LGFIAVETGTTLSQLSSADFVERLSLPTAGNAGLDALSGDFESRVRDSGARSIGGSEEAWGTLALFRVSRTFRRALTIRFLARKVMFWSILLHEIAGRERYG
jgi:hypothetical protein